MKKHLKTPQLQNVIIQYGNKFYISRTSNVVQYIQLDNKGEYILKKTIK